MKHKPHNEEHGNEESWLLPYSDLMTLLLAVFIVLFATSNIDAAKAEAMSKAFQAVLGIEGNSGTAEVNVGEGGGEGFLTGVGLGIVAPGTADDSDNEDNEDKEDKTDEMQKMLKELESQVAVLELDGSASIYMDERGLVVSFNNTILFDPGKADLKPEIEKMLLEICVMFNEFNNYIRVEGHTDNVPVNSEHFPSNWELSSARASRVVRFLVNECGILPERLSAVGYGEFKPLDNNNTDEGRAINRRVDIIILSSKYDDLEIAPFTIENVNQ